MNSKKKPRVVGRRYREGTIEGIVFKSIHSQHAAVLGAAKQSIAGLPDFLQKAETLAETLLDSPAPRRRERASMLLNDVQRLRGYLSEGSNASVIYDAVGAGLGYSNLRHELRDDDRPKHGNSKGLTRGKYFEFKKKAASKSELAKLCAMTPQKLRLWKKKQGFID